MTSIQTDVSDLQSLNTEIKNHLLKLRELRIKLSNTQKRIQEYLDIKNLPGVKYKGYVVIRNNKPARQKKKKQEQLDHSINVLKKYQIQDPENVLREILEARKGNLEPNKKLILIKDTTSLK